MHIGVGDSHLVVTHLGPKKGGGWLRQGKRGEAPDLWKKKIPNTNGFRGGVLRGCTDIGEKRKEGERNVSNEKKEGPGRGALKKEENPLP